MPRHRRRDAMRRRSFLKGATGLSLVAASSGWVRASIAGAAEHKPFDPQPGTWRTFEVTTRAEILQPVGVTRVWVPIPVVDGDYQRTLGDRWSGNARAVERVTDPRSGAAMLYAEFAADERAPVV